MISIHQRVFFSSLVTLGLFLSISAWVLDGIFSRYVEKNMQDRLQNIAYSLLASAFENKQGKMRLPELLANPKLNQPDSGTRAYVQNQQKNYQWFSASSLNSDFKPPKKIDTLTGEKDYAIIHGYSQLIFVVSWEDYQGVEESYILIIESDRAGMLQKIAAFRYQLILWLGGSGLLLLIGLTLLLSWSLKPLRLANQEVKQVQQGKQQQLSQTYPPELLILTKNINQLIQLSITRMQRYRNSLGDLTHSLKTPLAIIQGAYDSNNNQQLRTAIAEQLGRINELVQYQLQRASIAGESSDFSTVNVNQIIKKIRISLDKVYAEKDINCSLNLKEEILFRGDEGDLMEVIGNILDNAYKYCDKKVSLRLKQTNEKLLLIIEDDGKGIKKQQYTQLLKRGQRADNLLPGHGIGLGIVVNIVNQYKGEIKLSHAEELTGLRVKISLPK